MRLISSSSSYFVSEDAVLAVEARRRDWGDTRRLDDGCGVVPSSSRTRFFAFGELLYFRPFIVAI